MSGNISVLNYSHKHATFKQQSYQVLTISQPMPVNHQHEFETALKIAELRTLIDQFDPNQCTLSGGSAAAFFLAYTNIIPHSNVFDFFDDIDIYVSSKRFKEIANMPGIYRKPKSPNLTYDIPSGLVGQWAKWSGRSVQFMDSLGKLHYEIVNSFDLHICKVSYGFDLKSFFYDQRIPLVKLDKLIVDHANYTVGANRTFERMRKYLDRYGFKSIDGDQKLLEDFAAWEAGQVQIVQTPALTGPDRFHVPAETVIAVEEKEKCEKCKVELKWHQCQLICPTCKKVYAG